MQYVQLKVEGHHKNKKLNLWLAAPKGAIPSNRLLQLTDRMAVRQYNVIRSATSQSSSFPIILTRLGEPRSRPNPYLKLWRFRELNSRPHDT